jgi:hypothetical protein
MKRSGIALYLLAVGVVRHYGWLVFAPELRGSASKMLGGLAVLAVIPLLYSIAPSRPLLLVLAWWTFENAQIAICSAAHIVEPWAVEVGQSICSAKVGFDLGALGIMFAALLLARVYPPVTSNSYDEAKGKR